jgi:hypothetical protein
VSAFSMLVSLASRVSKADAALAVVAVWLSRGAARSAGVCRGEVGAALPASLELSSSMPVWTQKVVVVSVESDANLRSQR